MRKFLGVAIVAVAAVVFAATAVAEPPAKDVSWAEPSFVDDSTCPGIAITQSNTERDTTIEFSPTSLHFQRHGVATLAANGKSLTSNFSAMIFFDPTTTVVKVVGTVYNIQVPGGGTLLLDAGNVVFDFSTDPVTVLHVGGPHQQFSGDVAGLCGYLADP